jgi:pyridoxine 4-dehydrogenase
MGPPRDHDEAVAVLRRAVDLGVDHIDTAQFYGPDVSNQLIREALHPYSDDLVLVSKVGAFRDDQGGWLPGQRPEQLRSAVEDNLRSLGTDRLGAVNLRLMDEHGFPAEHRVPLEEQLAEMAALRDEGQIAGVGISTATRAQVEQAITQVGIVCVQNAFSLLDQSGANVLDLCHESGVAYVPYFPATSPALPTCRTSRLGPRSRACRRSPRTPPCGPSPSGSARRPPRLVWPGSSRTATTCC